MYNFVIISYKYLNYPTKLFFYKIISNPDFILFNLLFSYFQPHHSH